MSDVQLMLDSIDKLHTDPLQTPPPFRALARSNGFKEKLGDVEYTSSLSNYRFMSKYYRSIFGWIGANPSKKELKEAIEAVYIWDESDDIRNRIYVNNRQGYKEFYAELVKDSRNNIFLVSPKGSGKTFFLNYLLNTKTEELYEEHKMIWFRAEISKLYKYRTEKFITMDTNRSLFKLSDYLNFHIAFVAFKYKESHPVLKGVWKKNNPAIKDILIGLYETELSPAERAEIAGPSTILEEFSGFVDALEITEKISGGLQFVDKKTIKNILSKKKNLFTFRILSKLIQLFLKKEGYRTLLVLDGLDNIDYYQYHSHYMDILKEVHDILTDEEKKNIYNQRILVSMREETHAHIKEKGHQFFSKLANPYKIKRIDLSSLLSTKANVAENPEKQYFEDSSEEAIGKYKKNLELDEKYSTDEINDNSKLFFEASNKNLVEFTNRFLDIYIEDIKDILPEDHPLLPQFDKNLLFEVVYNSNLRAFIHNFLNIYSLEHAYRQSRKLFETRSFILREGQLLNGRLWLNSRELKFELGKCIPNIFWFDRFKTRKWHGLCMLRILQLIRNKISMNENDVFNEIKTLFNYDCEIIKERFYYALQQGLLNCECSTPKEDEEPARLFCLTKKADFIIDYIMLDLDLFYHLAIDTPLPEKLFSDKSILSVHKNEPLIFTKYNEASIVTSISFVRMIQTQHRSEMNKISSRSRHVFKLPTSFPGKIVDNIKDRSKNLLKMSPDRWGVLFEDIRKIS